MSESPEASHCPVCGWHCLGKGGLGCIDKPALCGYYPQSDKMKEALQGMSNNAKSLPDRLEEQAQEITRLQESLRMWMNVAEENKKMTETYRAKAAELEAELKFSEKQVQNSLVLIAEKDKQAAELEAKAAAHAAETAEMIRLYQQRGEQMKEMRDYLISVDEEIKTETLDTFDRLFDKDREPL